MKIALIRGVVTIAELSNLDFQRLKNISGLRWNRTTRCMVGPVSLNLLDGLARYYKLPADMETKRQRLGKTRREIDAERLAEDPAPLLPYPVKANLYKHQIRGANMALRAFGALDAKTPGGGFGELFEMGCGKTLTTIAVAGALYNLGKIDRVLVVAPTSVCSVWPHDLNQFATFPWEARVLLGDKKKRLKALNELENWPFKALRIAVINYESTHRDGIFEALAAYKPDLIVCDESQRIKNPSAAQSKALHKLGDAAPFRMILSGTPVQNNAVDLYSQYRFLDPAVYGANFYAFKNRYCIMGGYGQHQIVGYRNMDELVEKEHSVAYRITKEECLDLPQQTFINRYVQFTDAEQAEGIFLWAFEGLQRLVANNFKFTESDRIRENREAVKRDNNNIFDFMDSEGYIQRKADASISSKDFYEIYRMWCEENSLAPLKARSFSDAMIVNAGRFNLEHCNNITNSAGRRVWGFMGVEAIARPHINGFYGDSPCTYVPEDIPEEWRQVE